MYHEGEEASLGEDAATTRTREPPGSGSTPVAAGGTGRVGSIVRGEEGLDEADQTPD